MDRTPSDGRFTASVGEAGEIYQQRYWHEREFKSIERLKALMSESGTSMTTTSVAWVLANPVITSAIIGASRPEQLGDTLAAADVVLDESLKTQLDEVTHEYRWGDAAR